jgi:hypothetical protein
MAKLIILVLLVALIQVQLLAQGDDDTCSAELNMSNAFQTRHAMVPVSDIEELLNNPAQIQCKADKFARQGKIVIQTTSDFHAIFPIKKEKLIKVIADYNNYGGRIPRVVYGSNTCAPDTFNSSSYAKFEEVITAKIMGIGIDYNFVSNIYPVTLGPDEYATKWNMEESLDGLFFDFSGSWYLKEFQKDGKTYTYIRYFTVIGYLKPPTDSTWLLETFIPGEMKDILNPVYSLAKSK